MDHTIDTAKIGMLQYDAIINKRRGELKDERARFYQTAEDSAEVFG